MLRLLLLAALALPAADWPRFRGPNGAGVAPGNPPADFGPARNVAWRIAPPAGKSSPVLIGDRLFLTGHDGANLITAAYDTGTGRELWRRSIERRHAHKRHKLNDPAAPTPAADARRVVVFFPEFGLASYTLDGREEWTHPLPPLASMQGVAASPVLDGDSVYLAVDQARDSFLLALHAATGEPRWRVARPDAPGGVYSSPVLFRGGPEPVLAVLGDIELSAYSLRTGERVWWVSGLPSQAKTSPAVDGDRIVLSVNAMAEESQIPVWAALAAADANANGRIDLDEAKGVPRAVFPTVDRNRDNAVDEAEWTAFRAQALQPSATLSIRPEGRGDLTKTAVEWRAQRAVPNVPSPLAAGGLVYTVRNGGVAGIYNAATGAVMKEFRLPDALGDYYASPVAAGGRVYFASMEGKITVLEAGPDGRVLATIPMEEEIFATPAIAGNAIYVRTQQALYCFRHRIGISRAGKDQAQVAVPGVAIPLTRDGAEWIGALRFLYITKDAAGRERKRETATMNIRIDGERRRQLLEETLRVACPIEKGAALLTVTVEGIGTAELPLGEPDFRTESGLALVPFETTVPLTADDIVLYEDKTPRPASLYATGRLAPRTIPVEISLLFDASGSVRMAGALDPDVIRRGLLDEFPNVTIGIYGFHDGLVEFTRPTRDERRLRQAARAVTAMGTGSTPLFSSIISAIRQFDLTQAAVRILVVFSDGVSTVAGDAEQYRSALAAARRAGVIVYPVSLAPGFAASAMAMPRMPRVAPNSARGQALASDQLEMRNSQADFGRLADTGGRALSPASNADVLPAVLQELAKRLRGTYVAGYQPEAAPTPRSRQVRVELRDKAKGRLTGGRRVVVR